MIFHRKFIAANYPRRVKEITWLLSSEQTGTGNDMKVPESLPDKHIVQNI